jgi:hypothetical protein
MNLVEIVLAELDWIGLAQDRYKWRALVNMVMNTLGPLNAMKLSSGCTTDGLSSSAQPHRVHQSVSQSFTSLCMVFSISHFLWPN